MYEKSNITVKMQHTKWRWFGKKHKSLKPFDTNECCWILDLDFWHEDYCTLAMRCDVASQLVEDLTGLRGNLTKQGENHND